MAFRFLYPLLTTIPLWLVSFQGAVSAQTSPISQLSIAVPTTIQSATSDTTAAPTNIQSATSDTTVVQQSNQVTITGGQRSNGSNPNVVHQFEQFDLGTGDAANFVVTPDVANVISLIDSLQPSTIDGLLKLTSSNPNVASSANLFLVNPAGVVFGNNVSLNLPANLTVTTASSLLFEDTYRLSIDGSVSEIAASPHQPLPTINDLTGNPNGYFFSATSSRSPSNSATVASPVGSIRNRGTLQVSPQSTITLVGQYIQNDGDVVAPGGTANLVAVSGETLLRLTQLNGVLSLELTAPRSTETLSSKQFPELLTGGHERGATQIQINANGSQILTTPSSLIPASGGVLVRGTIDVSDDNIQGNVNILGETINLIGGDIHADGVSQAGTISIGTTAIGNTGSSTETVFVDRNSTLSANSTAAQGGVIRIRATDTVRFYGRATATGATPNRKGTITIEADNLDLRRSVAR